MKVPEGSVWNLKKIETLLEYVFRERYVQLWTILVSASNKERYTERSALLPCQSTSKQL